MIDNIETTISTMPEPPSILDPDNFDEKGEAFLPAEKLLATELQALIVVLQNFISQANGDIAILNSQMVYNKYQGDFVIYTVYGLGESISYNNIVYFSKLVGNVGNIPPAEEDVNWRKAYIILTVNAGEIVFDNLISGLSATDIKAAIDELAAKPSSTKKFIADGAIATLDPVSLQSDGTIKKVGVYGLPEELITAYPVEIDSLKENVISCYDTVNDKMLYLYTVGVELYVRSATNVEGVLTFSNEILVLTADSAIALSYGKASIKFDKISGESILMIRRNIAGDNYAFYAINASGANPIVGVETVEAGFYALDPCCLSYDEDLGKMIAINNNKICVVNIANSVITTGTLHLTPITLDNFISTAYIGSSKHFIAGVVSGIGSQAYIAVLDPDGDTITFGAISPTYTTSTYTTTCTYDIVEGVVFMVYSEYILNNYYHRHMRATISGTTISFSAYGVINNLDFGSQGLVTKYDTATGKILTFIHQNTTVSVYIHSLSGTVATQENLIQIANGLDTLPKFFIAQNLGSSGKFYISYEGYDYDPTGSHKIRHYSFTPPRDWTIADNFIGFANESALDTESCTVSVFGAIKAGFTALIPNKKYYLDGDGVISTTASLYEAGNALSTTELLITGGQ